jgi:hypothetical protein
MVRPRFLKRVALAHWKIRYWVMDKYYAQCRLVAGGLAVVVVLATIANLSREIPEQLQQGATVVRSVINLWVQLAILIISALLAYAMRPKVEGPKPQEGTIPSVEDGKSIIRIYGTVWIDDSIVLGWKQLGVEEIKSGGGKKWKPGLLPGTTNPIESWLDDKWNVSGLDGVTDPIGGGGEDD